LQTIQTKKQIDEQKNLEKIKKQKANEESIENWIKRQAEAMEIQNRIKRMKEEILKQEQKEKEKNEVVRKIQSEDAFRTWMKKKVSEKGSSLKVNQNKEENKRTHLFNKSKSKVIIGPYTNAKKLKEIQNKINMYNEYAQSTNIIENKRLSYNDDDNTNKSQEEANKKMEDSLQDLSSIEKNTPENAEHAEY